MKPVSDEDIKKINLKSRYDPKETILIKRLLQFYFPEYLRKKIINYLFAKFLNKDINDSNIAATFCKYSILRQPKFVIHN